jgi:hypothetical protein
LNSQTTVAVENPPESTPTTLIVSAFAVAELNRIKPIRDRTNLVRVLGMVILLSFG